MAKWIIGDETSGLLMWESGEVVGWYWQGSVSSPRFRAKRIGGEQVTLHMRTAQQARLWLEAGVMEKA